MTIRISVSPSEVRVWEPGRDLSPFEIRLCQMVSQSSLCNYSNKQRGTAVAVVKWLVLRIQCPFWEFCVGLAVVLSCEENFRYLLKYFWCALGVYLPVWFHPGGIKSAYSETSLLWEMRALRRLALDPCFWFELKCYYSCTLGSDSCLSLVVWRLFWRCLFFTHKNWLSLRLWS